MDLVQHEDNKLVRIMWDRNTELPKPDLYRSWDHVPPELTGIYHPAFTIPE
jgi:hypothetical protein